MIKKTYPVPTSYETKELLTRKSKSRKSLGLAELEKIKNGIGGDVATETKYFAQIKIDIDLEMERWLNEQVLREKRINAFSKFNKAELIRGLIKKEMDKK